MRDVVLLHVGDRGALERVVARTLEILDVVYGGEVARTYDSWTSPAAGLALVQATHPSEPEIVAMHRAPDEAFAYTGFVTRSQRSAEELRHLLTRRWWSGRIQLRESPGGIATFFHADGRERRCIVWTSHAQVAGLFTTRGDDCIAISNRSLISHLCGFQRTRPTMSTQWARRVLAGNYSLWDDTPYERTTQPPPRTMVTLHEGELGTAPHPVDLPRHRYGDKDPDAVAALNRAGLEAMSVLRRWPRAELALSGGKDSRYVAALAKAAGIDVDVVTHATAATGEGPAAAAVAAAVGLPLRFHTDSGITTGDDLLPTMLTNLRRCDGLLSENRQLAYRPPVSGGTSIIQGQAHHPRGGFRITFRLSRPEAHALLVSQNIGDPQLVVPELADERRHRLDEVLSGYSVRQPAELAYWMYADWRMSRWTIGAYTALTRDRPVLWPMMDERALMVISELSAYDRVSELAFFAAMCSLCPALAEVPLYEDRWKFDNGRAGLRDHPRGFEQRTAPFKEQSGGGYTPEKRAGTIQPLFRTVLHDLPCSAELRSWIPAQVIEAAGSTKDPSGALGVPHEQAVRFLWKVVAIALVLDGSWFSAEDARLSTAGVTA